MSRLSAKSLLLTPLAAAACILTTGCANMVTTATPISTFSQSGQISGKLHGGNQPISGSDVRMYAAGTTGYGSAPTLYAVTTSANDGFGSFGFTKTAGAGPTTTKVYGCPTDGTDPQMYITAKGGATQGTGNGNNLAAVFIIALGKCSTLGAQYVDLNEITTVATMAALQQYFSPGNANTDNTNHLGMPASTQAQAAFANAVSIIPNMANVVNGTVNTSSTVTATPTGSTTPVTVTITPEVAKIGTLANIIAACVNTTSNTSTACATLFQYAIAPNSAVTSQPALTFGTATDTLQALYYMLINPTSGSATALNNLFNLQSAQAVFQPMDTVAPTDWTVGIRYSSTSPCATGTANFLFYAYHLATDAAGNLWAVSNGTGGNLFELSPSGVPLTCNLGATVGKSTGFAFDVNGNAWVSGAANANMYKYSPSAATFTTWATGTTGIQFVAVDKSGNVIASTSAATGLNVFSFVNGANTTTPATATQISSTASASPFFFGIDTANRIFLSNSTSSNTFYELYPATDAANLNGYDTASIGSTSSTANAYGVGAGLAGTIGVVNGNYSSSTVSNTFSILTPATTAGTVTSTTTAQYSGGLNGPREIAVDGAGNFWTPNSTATSGNYVTGAANPATTYSVSEFSAAGTPLSGTGTFGTSATATANVAGGFQKDPAVLPAAGRGIAIDPSGNVWIGSNSTSGTGVLQIVGAAVPVVTPIPAALLAGATNTNAVSKP